GKEQRNAEPGRRDEVAARGSACRPDQDQDQEGRREDAIVMLPRDRRSDCEGGGGEQEIRQAGEFAFTAANEERQSQYARRCEHRAEIDDDVERREGAFETRNRSIAKQSVEDAVDGLVGPEGLAVLRQVRQDAE